MKRIASITVMAVLLTAASQARTPRTETEPVFERTYISTDKDAYVAGDRVWCSAFCFRADSAGLSGRSAVAYAQIVSSSGDIFQTAKIFLEGGRGGAYFDLPESMPTGNYRLFAFTAVNKNEKDYDFLQNSKIISVFNAKLPAKMKDGVELVSDDSYEDRKKSLEADPQTGDLSISVPKFTAKGGKTEIILSNDGDRVVSVSVSVYKDDRIAPAEDKSICSFEIPSVSGKDYVGNVLPEPEGEIIYASLDGRDRDRILASEQNVTAYISASSSNGDTYTSSLHEGGEFVFNTNNIFGNRELVTEVADLNDESLVGLVDIRSPFVSAVTADVPVLPLCKGIEKDIVERGRAMQRFRMEYTDSLAQFTARKEDFPYDRSGAAVYDLDDYTRFPTIREVLVEITPEVRVRGRNDRQRIQVLTKDLDGNGGANMTWETSLVLLDGIPVFKHSDMMGYDAMLLKEIQVWREKYLFGNKRFNGIVNFVSKRGNMAFMDFGSNVRILDFQGVCYPMDFTGRHAAEEGQDFRQTIFWKPELEVEAGRKVSLECLTPDYFGRFNIVVEGVTEDGRRIHKKTAFVVE